MKALPALFSVACLFMVGCGTHRPIAVTPLPSRITEADAIRLTRAYAKSLGHNLTSYPNQIVQFHEDSREWHVLFTSGTGTNVYWDFGATVDAYGEQSHLIIP